MSQRLAEMKAQIKASISQDALVQKEYLELMKKSPFKPDGNSIGKRTRQRLKFFFSKMRNSVEKFNFVQDKTQFSLQLEDSRLQAYDSLSHSRLTQ